MLKKEGLKNQLKKEIEKRGCKVIEWTDNDILLGGEIINENGSSESKIIAIVADEISLNVNYQLTSRAMKEQTIELGIIKTPEKTYYVDMSTGMQTDNPKRFISYSEYKKSKEDIKCKIRHLIEDARRIPIEDRTNYILTPIVVRAYYSKNNNLDKWLNNVDINKYNAIVDEINNELKINDNILQKIYNKDKLEYIKMALCDLVPTSIHYSNIIEELIRKSSMRQKKYMLTQNMLDVVSNFAKALNINDSCIELGSGLGCFLREQNSNFNIIKGIEKDEYLNDISKPYIWKW